MNINVQDNNCWICGGNKNITQHHALPQHLKPQKNIIVPVCDYCHKKINVNDLGGMYNYIYKLQKTNEGVKKHLLNLEKMLNERKEGFMSTIIKNGK